jgi:hypothetical protein
MYVGFLLSCGHVWTRIPRGQIQNYSWLKETKKAENFPPRVSSVDSINYVKQLPTRDKKEEFFGKRKKWIHSTYEETVAWQGCQTEYFQTENHYLDQFRRALKWKVLVYWIIFCPIDIFYGHLVIKW